MTSPFIPCNIVIAADADTLLLLPLQEELLHYSYFYITPLLPYPCPKRQISDFSKMKENADENFWFDEKGRKFSIRVENTVGKGEIARYKQFLLFSKCFQKTRTVDT